MQPLPLEEIRAKVLRQTPSPFPQYYCCVCRGPLGTSRKRGTHRICGNPACWDEAVRLDWHRP